MKIVGHGVRSKGLIIFYLVFGIRKHHNKIQNCLDIDTLLQQKH